MGVLIACFWLPLTLLNGKSGVGGTGVGGVVPTRPRYE